MLTTHISRSLAALAIMVLAAALSAQPVLNERPPGPEEWGFHPKPGETSAVNPPGFAWRPQEKATGYDVQVASDEAFKTIVLSGENVRYCVWCPDKTLAAGQWLWRFRSIDPAGKKSDWSSVRSFTIPADTIAFPMPRREELLGRIPKQHPRLFVRPEQLPQLRELAKGDLKTQYAAIIRDCDKLLKNPPPTAEPPKYPPDVSTKSEAWRVIWWGNREYTIKVLNSAATLGFARLLGGNEQYGQLGKRLLLDAAKWDPKGSTNYRYNDEAGMPYVYFFSRAYTFLYDTLSDDERRLCRDMMRIRGNEIAADLSPRHLGKPYASHSNRAWHKLGEAGIAFMDEIPEAGEWTWLAMNVFWNVYPVWSDEDGGWHEGTSYWESYIHRFTYFADVMRVDLGVDAFKKPYFSRLGYYAVYLQPPGSPTGGFGDLVAERTSKANVSLISAMAVQAKNPYWQWYVEAQGGPAAEGGYIGFVRGSMPPVEAKSPIDLPSSRVFHGIGQAALNSNLLDAKKNVQVLFKSSPFGTQSHGYDSNNAFLLTAYGQRLLVSTGRRDIYGSDHHSNWMWDTKSVNSILVDGQGQTKHSAAAQGRIIGFFTSQDFDYVAGECAASYAGRLKRFERHILFVKPFTIIIFDRLEAPKPADFQWLLHSPVEMKLAGQQDIRITSGDVNCRVAMLYPPDLKLSLTDKYAPPPRDRIKISEWHLTAATAKAAAQMEFVTVIQLTRGGNAAPELPPLKSTAEAHTFTFPGMMTLTLPVDQSRPITAQSSRNGKVWSSDAK